MTEVVSVIFSLVYLPPKTVMLHVHQVGFIYSVRILLTSSSVLARY